MTNARLLLEAHAAAKRIGALGVNDIVRRYGPDAPSGELWLPFHNGPHTQRVMQTASALATALAKHRLVDPRDVALLPAGSGYHDHEQTLGPLHNERQSFINAATAMTADPFTFSPRDYQRVEAMIMATAVSFDATGRMIQHADGNDLIQAAIADADLSALGRSVGPHLALRLFLELEMGAGRLSRPTNDSEFKALQPDDERLHKFLEYQDKFLGEHSYYLEISKAQLDRGKAANQAFGRQLVTMHSADVSFHELWALTEARAMGPAQSVSTELTR